MGKYFGTGPEFWSNLQSNYDLCIAASNAERELAVIQELALA